MTQSTNQEPPQNSEAAAPWPNSLNSMLWVTMDMGDGTGAL